MDFLIITGMSGAGKSQVIRIMEDLGYLCVDNLPPILIPKFVQIIHESKNENKKAALVVDVRGGELLNDLIPALEILEKQNNKYEIMFLEASDESLIKRFKESRRMHPLADRGRIPSAIKDERGILEKIKKKAMYVIDTSNLNIRQLKTQIQDIFTNGNNFKGIIIEIISFGFKNGIPTECDLVFDVRFITNPFYIDELKELSGKDQAVKDYVLEKNETKEFISKLTDMLEFLIPNYVREGKSQLVIGIGCTGGRHRSVAIAEYMYNALVESKNSTVLDHRDILKPYKNLY